MGNEQPKDAIITIGIPTTQFVYQPRRLNVYPIIENEIDNLSEISESSSIYLGFMTLCIGAFATLLITVLTIHIDEPVKSAVFIGAVICTGILGLFFGILWNRCIRKSRREKERLKGRQ